MGQRLMTRREAAANAIRHLLGAFGADPELDKRVEAVLDTLVDFVDEALGDRAVAQFETAGLKEASSRADATR